MIVIVCRGFQWTKISYDQTVADLDSSVNLAQTGFDQN